MIWFTEPSESDHEPFAPFIRARSVIRPSRPITLLTRYSSFIRPSRLSASWLYVFATSPMTPLFCGDSRTPTSPSLAARRASSSSCKSFLLISTVPLSAARRDGEVARLGVLPFRVFVSGEAATVDSFM